MAKGKPRWYPNKPQNTMQLYCPRFEEYKNGICYCHGGHVKDAYTCHGNPHNCVKTKYHKAASRSNKQIIDDV